MAFGRRTRETSKDRLSCRRKAAAENAEGAVVGREGLGQVPRSERAVRLESGRLSGAGASVPVEVRGAYLGAEGIGRRAA